MKIIYNILGTFNSGGMERVLANKANYLARLGYTVIIISTDQKNRKPYFDLDSRIQCIDLGINYTEDLNKGLIKKSLSYIKKQRKHFKALKRELFRIKADIVISMFDFDASFLYKIKDGSKKILEIHFSRFKRLQYNRKGVFRLIDLYMSRQDLRIVRNYDRFVVLTEEDKGYWGELANIEVIPNAHSFIPKAEALLDNKKVLAIGRFDYQKGFDDLIKAWDIVHRQNPDWVLNIYGQGPLKNYLCKLIDDLSLGQAIFLLEPTKDIENVYLDHSIMSMSSRYEGLPMVLLEAQACGLPLVSYACKCGPRDIIKDNGILVDEGNIEVMAQSLLRLINEEDTRKQMGTYSRQYAVNFSEDRIMQKWIELFNSLIS